MRKVDKKEKSAIIRAFVKEFMLLMQTNKGLQISISDFSIFKLAHSSLQRVNGFHWENDLSKVDRFDLILGDLPIGMNRVDFAFGSKTRKIRRNWIQILKSVDYLNENGKAIFLIEPSGFNTLEGIKLEEILNSKGYYVNAIFNMPEGILMPEICIVPVLILVTKKQTKSIFVAELLDESQSKQVANNYYSGKVVGDLIQGMEIEPKGFHGFKNIKIKQQIERLETQYKEYEECKFEEIIKEIHTVIKDSNHFVEKQNSIYVPKTIYIK